jgi:hypothetical protein
MEWKNWVETIGVVGGLAQVISLAIQVRQGGLPSVAGLSSKAVFSGIFNLCVVALLTMGVLKLGDLAQLDASVRSLEAASRPQITPENVETHIRSWLDTLS